MARKKTAKTEQRQRIRGKGWRKTSTIAADKFKVVSTAILKTLRTTPIAFRKLVSELTGQLKNFDGSIAWYTITCLRELEMQGSVTRHLKPVGYSKTKGPRSKRS